MPEAERIRTGVLVIGGGLAALKAAAAAREAGADVVLAVKGLAGRGGSSAATTAGYAAVLPDSQTGDSLAAHYEDTWLGGAGMADPALLRILVEDAADRALELERLGVPFLKEDGHLHLAPSGEHSYPRVIHPANHIGTDLTLPLARHILEIGVRVMESTMALELLVAEGRVVGAVCLDLKRERLLAVQAGATILATGGCGRLFPVSSNPRDVTGDGFALAAAAGAELRDMEFIQFYPFRCVDPFTGSRMPVQPPTFVSGARLYNRRGERFMEQYDPARLEGTTRDIAARAIFDQIRTGRAVGGGVRLDLSEMSEEVFKKTNPKMSRALQVDGIDYRSYPFVVAPEGHYFMGGVRIDGEGRSTVPGLFAAGEVAGGIQGANRLTGNALPETQVFGRRAGQAAAHTAAAGSPAPPVGQIQAWEQVLRTAAPGDTSPELVAVRKELQEKMELSLGIVRHAETMKQGLEYLRELRARLEMSCPATVAGLREWRELRFLAEVGEMCGVAALLRTESRGAHYREDYPERDDSAWRRPIILRRQADDSLTSRLD